MSEWPGAKYPARDVPKLVLTRKCIHPRARANVYTDTYTYIAWRAHGGLLLLERVSKKIKRGCKTCIEVSKYTDERVPCARSILARRELCGYFLEFRVIGIRGYFGKRGMARQMGEEGFKSTICLGVKRTAAGPFALSLARFVQLFRNNI